MRITTVFMSVGAILIGLVVGVPIVASIFADEGPYQQLVDLPSVGTECVYGPGNTIYVPNQTSFTLTGPLAAVTPIPSDETISAAAGTSDPTETTYGAGNITLVGAEGPIATVPAGTAYQVDDAEGNAHLIGVGAAGLDTFDCDPADGFFLTGVPIGSMTGSCTYGNPSGSSYEGAIISGTFITDDIVRLMPDDFTITIDDGIDLEEIDNITAGTFTIGGTNVPTTASAWTISVNTISYLLGFSADSAGSALGTACDGSNADDTAVAFAAPSTGSVAGAYEDNSVEGNVKINSGGTSLTESPYRGIIVAIIALIPLLVVGFFAFRFFYMRR